MVPGIGHGQLTAYLLSLTSALIRFLSECRSLNIVMIPQGEYLLLLVELRLEGGLEMQLLLFV